jgi:Flp pilus assembly protein TadD
MKLYFEALPMETDSEQRAKLLDQSAAILKELIENKPDSLEAHRKLMGVYLLKQDYTNGIRVMQNAITLSPEDPKLFVGLAFLYEHSGALYYAREMLAQALILDPEHKVAKDYMVVIKQKIETLQMDQLHSNKEIVKPGHGNKPQSSPH